MSPVLGGWFEAFLRRRFAWLLALLLAAIGVDPVLEAMGMRARGLEWMLALALLAAAGRLRCGDPARAARFGHSAVWLATGGAV